MKKKPSIAVEYLIINENADYKKANIGVSN
jgi:hypothetical protein